MIASATDGKQHQSLGIGLNVNEIFNEKDRTSIREITGVYNSRERMLANLFLELESLLALSMEELIDVFKQYEGLCGQQVLFFINSIFVMNSSVLFD